MQCRRGLKWSGIAGACALGLMLISALPAQRISRLRHAAQAFRAINRAPDGGIPREILEHAQCVMVVPGLKKAGFIFGGSFGRGVVTCRTGRSWSAPLFVTLGSGSWGLQIGAQEEDLVLIIMNKAGEKYLLRDKFSIGGDLSATAGPVGRNFSAQTDALLHAKMLAYSRSRGLFGGITLKGGIIKQDPGANRQFYGRVPPSRILGGAVAPPAAARAFIDEVAAAAK